MGLQTKKDFAEMCGLPPKNLATYIGRGKVIVGDGDLIDDKHPLNKAFLVQRKNKITEKKLVEEITSLGIGPGDTETQTENIPDDFHTAKLRSILEGVDPDSDGIMPYDRAVRLLKYLDTEKRKKEIALLHLKEEKLKGAMVPSDLIQPIIKQHNQSMVTEFKNAGDDFLRVFSQKKALTGEEMADLKGQFTKIINEAMAKATNMTVKSIEAVVDNYAETRSKGERL